MRVVFHLFLLQIIIIVANSINIIIIIHEQTTFTSLSAPLMISMIDNSHEIFELFALFFLNSTEQNRRTFKYALEYVLEYALEYALHDQF